MFINRVVKTLIVPCAAMLLAACQSAAPSSQAANGGSVAGAQCGAFGGDIATPANAVEPNSGREFFLEYPCDLQAGEPVTVVLNLHGGGSAGAWQRLYFPIGDYAEEHRLVVASPTAVTTQPFRMWTEAADDEYLQDLTELLIDQFGKDSIRSFWLAGHSQGGLTSFRIACSEYFGERVDGVLSLAGGRAGMRFGGTPACDYSHIFTTGELDSAGVAGIPDDSPLAERFNCEAKTRHEDIVDSEAGKVYDNRSAAEGRPSREGWGGKPGPGSARVYIYPSCDDGRVVADIIRENKGHTEGLEPKVTEKIVEMMVSVPGGKVREL